MVVTADPKDARCAPNSRLAREEEQDAKRKPAAPGKRPITMRTVLTRRRSSPGIGRCPFLELLRRRDSM
jgi:hypothetical protein